ncbi:MAG TPA: sigma-70 family RNA polymerase sigma factor [Acidimicrobiales bacterium]|jgi:RNA polymerase sigma-70 factor (ECF subfamily)|nr:sigma-70 family RNA polymerase sigma factor [Acidimicrobiales bacterium]
MDDLTRLALAAADGDRVCLAAFVRAAQPDVWRLCAYLGGRDRADDLTQETFLRAIPALPRFEARSGARSWLLAIARRTCADSVRRQIRRRGLLQRLQQSRDDQAGDASSSVDLDALVAGLDVERRAAFVLTQVLGLSYAEAAEVCHCPIGTIRSRVARARGELVAAVQQAESV